MLDLCAYPGAHIWVRIARDSASGRPQPGKIKLLDGRVSPVLEESRLFHCLCECDFRAYAFCACLVIIHLAERLDGVRPALGQRFRRVRLAGGVEVIHHFLRRHRTAAHDRILPVRDRFFCPGRSICCAVLCSVFCCPGICPDVSLRRLGQLLSGIHRLFKKTGAPARGEPDHQKDCKSCFHIQFQAFFSPIHTVLLSVVLYHIYPL